MAARPVWGTMKGKCRFYRCDDKRKLEYEAQIGKGSSCRCLLEDLNTQPPAEREPRRREVTSRALLVVCLACRAYCLRSEVPGACLASLTCCLQ